MKDGEEIAAPKQKTGGRVPPVVLKLAPRLGRFLYVAAAVGVVAFAVLITSLRYWLLPEIAQYREEIAASISRAAGQRVTIGSIAADWQGLRPHLVLEQIQVYDRQARPALHFNHIEGTLSWWSLALGEIRLSSLLIDQPSFDIRRLADGRIFVAGIELNQAESGTGFADWVLRQYRIVVRNAAISWQDDLRQAPPLILRDANLRLENFGRRHRFGLRAVPPETLAQPVDVRGDFKGGSLQDFSGWQGTLYSRLDYTDIAAWRNWLTLPFDLRQGAGGVQIWAGFADKKWTGVTADVYLSGVRMRFAPDLPELELSALKGRLGWRDLNPGYEVSGKKLSFEAGGGPVLAPADASVRFVPAQGKKPAQGEIRADGLALEPLLAMARYFPLPQESRQKLEEIAPRGTFQDFAANWSGDWQAPQRYAAKGRFEGLGFKPYGKLPGVSGLSGNLDVNEKGGALALNARAAALEFPGLFRQPLALDVLTSQASWKTTQDGQVEVKLTNAAFANDHAAGTAYGRYRSVPGGPGEIDLSGQLTRADARHVARYMPLSIGQETRDWLARSLLAGQSGDVRLRLKGNLADFPFADGKSGVFEVSAKASGGVLEYASGWPRIENIGVDLLFRGKRMEIFAQRGNTYGVKLSKVRVVIPDLLTHDEMLEVDGEAQGPTDDMLKFIAQSPVNGMIDGFAQGMQATGNGKFALQLRIPLRHRQDARVTGGYQFVANRIVFAPGGPPLEQVNGTLRFTESTVSLPNGTAQFLGGPTTIEVATRQGEVQVNVQGKATAAGLRKAFDHPVTRQMQGTAAWRGQVAVRKKAADMTVFSSLQGLGLDLPAPFAKKAAEIVPLRLERKSAGEGQDAINLSYGRLLAARLERRREGGSMKIARGVIALGSAPAKLPPSGVWLTGGVRYLNLDQWRAILSRPPKSEAPLGLAGVNLNFGTLDAFDKRFNDLHLTASAQGDGWKAILQGRELSGEVYWKKPEGKEKGKVTARLKSFVIPPGVPVPAEIPPATQEEKLDLPALDIIAENFWVKQKKLGRLELLAAQSGRDWNIQKLQLSSPESTLVMDGVWQDWLRQPVTRANLRLEVNDIGKLLARFGYPDSVKGGSAKLRGQLAWPGGPQEFKPALLSGEASLEAKKGQFLQVEPGIGKLLGILSLQALPRRITLDFRDVFSQGFAFDEISASMRISRGVVKSEDFKMDGPAAKVTMSGETDLAHETQNLRVRVVPSLGESVSMAGALLGGPVVGLTALLLQKALKDPFGQIAAYEYSITGTWDNPVVAKIEKPGRREE